MFKNKLTDRIGKYNILKEIENSFKKDFSLTSCLGAELEFYLLNIQDSLQVPRFEEAMGQKIKKGKGNNQYEVEIPPSTDVADYPEIICKMRDKISKQAERLGLIANFEPKPFPNDYGNSMHIHFNFLEDDDVEKYAKILCHCLPQTIKYFLQKKEDYSRLNSDFMAPTHISYGGNNRTTLIRIPDSSPRRLEHRLASADADPHRVIYAILNSIKFGLKYPSRITKIEKTYGNASDPQYNLVKII